MEASMRHCETPAIRLRPDGTIDTFHYMMIGRQRRSEHAREMAKGALPKHGLFSLQTWSLAKFRAW